MSTGYQTNDQEGLYYLTFQVVDWIVCCLLLILDFHGKQSEW
jgi:hypothetical protein